MKSLKHKLNVYGILNVVQMSAHTPKKNVLINNTLLRKCIYFNCFSEFSISVCNAKLNTSKSKRLQLTKSKDEIQEDFKRKTSNIQK